MHRSEVVQKLPGKASESGHAAVKGGLNPGYEAGRLSMPYHGHELLNQRIRPLKRLISGQQALDCLRFLLCQLFLWLDEKP